MLKLQEMPVLLPKSFRLSCWELGLDRGIIGVPLLFNGLDGFGLAETLID